MDKTYKLTAREEEVMKAFWEHVNLKYTILH